MTAKQINAFESKAKIMSQKQLSSRVWRKSLVFRVFFVLICTAILFYQTSQQINDYLKFQTIVMIDNEDQRDRIEFPSVSICQKYPLVRIMEDKQEVSARVPVKYIDRLDEYGVVASHRGFEILNLRKTKKGDEYRPPSSPIEAQEAVTMLNKFEPIGEQHIQCRLSCHDCGQCFPTFSSIGMISQCQTYFSEIRSDGKIGPNLSYDLKTRERGTDVSVMAFFAINVTMFGLGKEDYNDIDLYVAVHASRGPVGSERAIYTSRRFVIKQNKSYDLSYSRKVVKKLETPYSTNCREYSSAINSTDIYNHSRELCLNHCILDRTRKRYGCLTSYSDVIQGDQFSREIICNSSFFENSRSENGIYMFEFRSRVDCLRWCKPECTEETLSSDLNEVDDSSLFERFQIDRNSSDMAFVTLLDRKVSESHFHHSPKTKICDLLSNIGGLFSLWLGLSILNVYDFIASIPSLKTKFN